MKIDYYFYFGSKEEYGNFWVLGKGGISSCFAVIFGVGITKVVGLKWMMIGTFFWGINGCILIRSDFARSYCWNFTSWVEN